MQDHTRVRVRNKREDGIRRQSLVLGRGSLAVCQFARPADREDRQFTGRHVQGMGRLADGSHLADHGFAGSIRQHHDVGRKRCGPGQQSPDRRHPHTNSGSSKVHSREPDWDRDCLAFHGMARPTSPLREFRSLPHSACLAIVSGWRRDLIVQGSRPTNFLHTQPE